MKAYAKKDTKGAVAFSEALSAELAATCGVSDPAIFYEIFGHLIPAIARDDEDRLEYFYNTAISLFREMECRDAYEAMIISKLIAMHFLSMKELAYSAHESNQQMKDQHLIRFQKLTRLWNECKERLDKHRRPEQKMKIEYVHVADGGKAIIGSELNSSGSG